MIIGSSPFFCLDFFLIDLRLASGSGSSKEDLPSKKNDPLREEPPDDPPDDNPDHNPDVPPDEPIYGDD
jgi:hypothetical protein